MKDIAIYGAGGFGREVACLVNLINKHTLIWNFIGFFDDNSDLIGTENDYGKVLGGIKELNQYDGDLAVVLAIGNPVAVRKIVDGILNDNIYFPNLLASDAVFMDEKNFIIGRGNIICSKCWFSCNVSVGDFNIFNVGVIVGHDACVGNYNSFMPSVNISGEVVIGDGNFFGVASAVLQHKKIGCNTVIGGNSLIIKNTKDGQTYMGNPASAL